MTSTDSLTAANQRLDQLLGFLRIDPGNLALAGDTANAALAARRPEVAREVLERLEQAGGLPANLLNLKGLAALAEARFDEALPVFETLLADNPGDPALRFNLAWARSMTGDHQGSADLIDEDVVAVAPRAAALKVNALHHLQEGAAALAWGAKFADRMGDDQALMGALCMVAMDEDEPALARVYADRAGGSHEGIVTHGMLALDGEEIDQALALFDEALVAEPDSPRARLGRGLAMLAQGDNQAGALDLDRCAEAFGDHLGSWIAAGWAWLAQGDQTAARQRFDHAMALDDTFAETHGALAVLDIIQGDLDSARRRTEVALRLDRQCLSAALARSLMLSAEGRPEAAARVRQIALNRPVGADGRTLAQAMVSLGMKTRR